MHLGIIFSSGALLRVKKLGVPLRLEKAVNNGNVLDCWEMTALRRACERNEL